MTNTIKITTLSQKRQALTKFNDGIESIDKYLYKEEDVKEFIKSLKERFCLDSLQNFYPNVKRCQCSICLFIDSLAGEKLI